ncbi:hypothetical protein ACJMK2_034961 [Sinanodonta woodiana]|uniref:SOCS box domain-containing protein n=1 Tax=Sinanodonta woodiana TaxID=1069815 RepID=A0ABD3WTA6_SINWO
MGAQESKGGSYGLMGPSSVVANMNRQAQFARPWALLHQCSLEQWKHGHGEAAGFKETTMTCSNHVFKDCSPTFCTSRQGLININKHSKGFSFRRKNKFTKMAEHFEYNHIPAQLSSIQNFHVKSVLCYRENTVVLHLVRNMNTMFGIIDISSNKFLGIFGKQMVEFFNSVLRGEISPDGLYCMIKIPGLKTGNNSFQFQMYDLKTRNMVAQITTPYDTSLFAFDPRFCSSQFAATSFVQGEDNSLSLVRTKSWEVFATNPRVDDMRPSNYPVLKDLFYSKDGCLIFAIMVTDGCNCRDRKSRRLQSVDVSVYIFNGDTSQTLHCIQYHRYTCGQHLCPVNYLPVFSQCGSRMAILLNDCETVTDHIQVYKLPTPLGLQNRCRIRILQQHQSEDIEKLPLPGRLIQYLQFKPEYP